eukprot:16385-Heterococcus_DN1.PRE.1
MLKGRYKQKEVEDDIAQKQSSWQSFATSKVAKKKGLRKEPSIFATPDAPDSKVGVIGSGRGVTDFQQKKKYKPNP